MRVFISGVAGFLGSHLAETFLTAGHQVVGCDNLLCGERDNVPAGVAFEASDCCDLEAMRRLTRGVELVYHCAAVATEGLSVFSPSLVSRNCYQSTATLLSASVGQGVRRFVFCSSMARYGAVPVPFREDQTPKPEDPYGIAKYAGELLLANVCETHGVEPVVAVPHNIYGPRQRYDDPYRNVVGIMANRMLQGKQPVIYGRGEQRRCFSFISDCITPLVRLGCQPDAAGETFNIGPDEEFVSILDLARLMSDIIGFRLDPIFVASRAREVAHATCSADKARQRLGYATTTTLRAGLEMTIQWIAARGPRAFRYDLPIEIESNLVPGTWKERLL